MLSAEEQNEIRRVLADHRDARAACIECLKVVQRRRGHVPDEGIEALSRLLGIPGAEIEGVATFFNQIYRKPVGRHVIMVCESISCWIVGRTTVRDHLERRLGIGAGQTTDDRRFTLLVEPCLGACDRAPAMMIDDDLHGELTPETIDAILERYP